MHHLLTTGLRSPVLGRRGARLRADAPGTLVGAVNRHGAVLHRAQDPAEVGNAAGAPGRLTRLYSIWAFSRENEQQRPCYLRIRSG